MPVTLKRYALNSHQGPYLNINEDLCDVDLANQLFMIFDGFGGSGIGDTLVKELCEETKKFFLKVGGDKDATMPFYYSNRYTLEGNAILNAVHLVHRNLFKKNQKLDFNKRGAASAIIATISEGLLFFAGIGNCSCFLIRQGNMNKIIEEDTLKFFSLSEFSSEYKTAPMNAIGLFEDLQVQTREIKINEGDTFLFLTDGVYARLQISEIKYMIESIDKKGMELLDTLFYTANARGNVDNQSALLLRF